MSDAIPLRQAKLSQLLDGKISTNQSKYCRKDALVDGIIAIHDECARKHASLHGKSPKHLQLFMHKVESSVKELKSLRVHIDDFEFIKIIGNGHFGQVSVVKEKESGDVMALKVLRKSEILTQLDASYFEEEKEIMIRSNSSWLTQLHYAFQDDKNLYLAMDYHPGGDLAILLSRYDSLSEDMTQFYVAEMVLAINTLHTLGYVHRDIKPDNFLIDRIGHLKLTDFGSAAKLDQQGRVDLEGISEEEVSGKMPVGTPDYIAPELLTSMTGGSSERSYTRSVDWWSLGVVCYELLTGKRPFSDESQSVVTTYNNIMKYKEKLSFPDGECELSSHGKIFIQSLLCDNTSRLSYEQIITDDFLHDVDLDRIRNSTPPIIPKVTGVADTSNFDECEPRHPSPRQHLDDQLEFRDVPFIGFTSYRNIALLKASHRGSVNSPSLLDSLMPSSPAGRGSISLERKESQLKQELQCWCQLLEALREDSLQKSHKISRLEKTIHKQREDISYLTATNDSLNETNERLTASLEATKQVYDDLTSQTEDFLSVLKSKEDERNEYESYQSQELDYSKSEVERLDKLNVEKDVAILSLQKKVKRLEEECSSLASDLSQERKKRAVRQASTQSNGGSNTVVIKCEIETQQQKLYKQNNETVTELLQQLDKVQEFNRATKDSIDKMRDEKEDLERQLRSIREVSARRETDRQTQQEHSQLKQSPRPSSISEGDKRKLQQLEIRNSKLSSDVHEKSQQVNQLANQINDLAAQLESTMREAETEKRLRKEIETSLQCRIAELERELRQVKNSHDSLQRTRESAGDMKTHQTRTISDLENTIEILKASEDKLQALVAAQRDGFDEEIDRRDQKGRQETRRWAEIVGELKQENMFLERKLEQLNKRLETKDNFEQSYKDRLDAARNLGRQEKREREEEVGRLNKKILELEMSHADLKSEHEKTSRSCRIFERKYTDLQNNVQTTERNYHQRVDDIQNEKNVLEHQIETLQEETAIALTNQTTCHPL